MRDKKALTTLKQKTAQTVMAGCKQRSNILHWLSFIQFDGRVGAEFDIAPQMFTPVTYEVPCIFVKSDQIDIGWRPLSASSGGRIERTFHPVIFAKAFYAGIKAFTLTSFTITTSRLKKDVSTPSELRVEVSAKNTGTSPSTGPQANPTSGRAVDRSAVSDKGSLTRPKQVIEPSQARRSYLIVESSSSSGSINDLQRGPGQCSESLQATVDSKTGPGSPETDPGAVYDCRHGDMHGEEGQTPAECDSFLFAE